MAEVVKCPDCQHSLRVPATLTGRKVKCPHCGRTFAAGAADSPVRPSRVQVEDELFEEVEEETEDEGYEEIKERPNRPRRSSRPRRRPGPRGKPHRGIAVFLLGLFSLSPLGIVLGPIAWAMGNNDLKEMEEGKRDPEGKGLTNAGRILGVIGTLGALLMGVCCLGWFLLTLRFGGAGG
jgi:hypothetical protein